MSQSSSRRFYVPTPAEIIQEARETIMGIRAVPTNRPFTPKERDRILFGSNRKGDRPPSAVNLSYLQKENTRIKLPSITLPNKQRCRPMTTKAVLSLDNLVEDSEGELFALNATAKETVPSTRKSHSCPQERTQSALFKEFHPEKEAWTKNEYLASSLDSSFAQKKKKVIRLESLPSMIGQDPKPTEDFTATELESCLPSEKDQQVEIVHGEREDENEDLIAVLSEGKLIWELNEKISQKEAQLKLDEMKKNLTHVQNRMTTLRDKIEEIEGRPSEIQNEVPKEKAYKRWIQKQKDFTVDTTNLQLSKKETSSGWDFFWKNTYFRPKEEKIDPALEYLEDMVDTLKALHAKGTETSELEIQMNFLYMSMKSGGYFSNNALPASLKTKLLQTLYLFAEEESAQLLLHTARLILSMNLAPSLPIACKLIFKVTRSDINDHWFLEIDDILELFLEGIGRASPLEASESCIYSYGALKFLTMNHTLLSKLLNLGALDLVTLHLKMINDAASENAEIKEQTRNALYQLTGTLRNIAAGEGVVSVFIATNVIPTVCQTLLLFRRDEEIVVNISRILSLLSNDEEIPRILLGFENLLVFLIDLLRQYKIQSQIIIRISYTLGNVLAISDVARVQMSRNERCVPTLLELFEFYMEKHSGCNEQISEEEHYPQDVLVKIIRVLANMSMNPIVGSNLSPTSQDKNASRLLKILTTLLTSKPPAPILLAALGCLNNISYYTNSNVGISELSKGLINILSSASNECVVEAARVLGNLTRHKHSRDVVFEYSGIEILENLLKTGDREAVHCICGVLINLLLDSKKRKEFLLHHGIDILMDTTRRFPEDWPLAGLICRAIWNACADHISIAVQNNDMTKFLTTLANYLEEDSLKENDAEWEEFAVIATDLLERFNSHLEDSN